MVVLQPPVPRNPDRRHHCRAGRHTGGRRGRVLPRCRTGGERDQRCDHRWPPGPGFEWEFSPGGRCDHLRSAGLCGSRRRGRRQRAELGRCLLVRQPRPGTQPGYRSGPGDLDQGHGHRGSIESRWRQPPKRHPARRLPGHRNRRLAARPHGQSHALGRYRGRTVAGRDPGVGGARWPDHRELR